jgi:prepilin-type N-terminal cleavage/methylation domain-containing protein
MGITAVQTEAWEMKFFRTAQKGFTLVEIMIVVAIIGILIAIAVPGFVRARTQSRARACQENLTKIDGAKEQYALERNLAQGATITLANLINTTDATQTYMKQTPVCPAGGTYTPNAIGTDPTCSYASTDTAHALSAIGTTTH